MKIFLSLSEFLNRRFALTTSNCCQGRILEGKLRPTVAERSENTNCRSGLHDTDPNAELVESDGVKRYIQVFDINELSGGSPKSRPC